MGQTAAAKRRPLKKRIKIAIGVGTGYGANSFVSGAKVDEMCCTGRQVAEKQQSLTGHNVRVCLSVGKV